MVTVATSLTLDAFLQLPEIKPATEFIDGQVIQKPLPQGEHSRLQGKLCQVINQAAESAKVAYAFPELRCTFGGASVVPDIAVVKWDRIPRASVVPDIAVVKWDRIPRTASGRVANRFNLHPNWAIEILLPDQSQTKVLGNLLHCSEHGTELGWLIDPAEETVLLVLPDQRVRLLRGTAQLIVLSEIALELTVEQVFSWLVFG